MLSLRDDYRTEILGLGEIYEALSCGLLVQRLRRRYPGHYLITFLSRREVSAELVRDISKRRTVVASGFADIPPWSSGYRPVISASGASPLLKFAVFAKPLFQLLVSLEQWYPCALKARKAHMVWLLHSSGDVTNTGVRD